MFSDNTGSMLVCFAAAIMFGWFFVAGLARGSAIMVRWYTPLERDKNPVGFWLAQAFNLSVAVLGLLGGAQELLR